MVEESEERAIREALAELRAADEDLAPAFSRTWRAAEKRLERPQTFLRPVSLALAACALIGSVVVLLRTESPDVKLTERRSMEVAAWRPPTASLLRRPSLSRLRPTGTSAWEWRSPTAMLLENPAHRARDKSEAPTGPDSTAETRLAVDEA
ncbi:MAG: hypothetical protein ACE5D3_00720 [Candidatus Binatia bacterium]